MALALRQEDCLVRIELLQKIRLNTKSWMGNKEFPTRPYLMKLLCVAKHVLLSEGTVFRGVCLSTGRGVPQSLVPGPV